ncbi:MAG: alcohol dehydrogenase, partial [Actinomycetota bacterium]|nr:alcohol dehydrogenase [Actinomycetota bacterium]
HSGARLYGFVLPAELARAGPGAGAADLARLASIAASDRLQTPVGLELGWDEAAGAVQALLDRQVTGKAVLRIG